MTPASAQMALAVPGIPRRPVHARTPCYRGTTSRAYQDAGRTAEAIPLFERTLADCERLLGPDHPNTKVVRENLAALTA